MAFENIKDIKSVSVKAGYHYFLDANIWIYAMNSIQLSNNADKGNPLYTNFFFKIIESELKPRPRIVLGSLLMSEIINTYLRKYAMPDYLYNTYKKKGLAVPLNFDFKSNYRPTEHFRVNYKMILNEVKAYNESILIVDDAFTSMRPFQFGKNCLSTMDFNDYYYYLLACKLNKELKNFAFVTNDGDFGIKDFEIYTSSIALLDLKTKQSAQH